MTDKDIRWQQRFSNYKRALAQLTKFMEKKELNDLEQQGLIQAFEYTHELAWNTLRDFLKNKGNLEIYGSKDATREAFSLGLISDGEVWMDMIKSRNLTSHTYNEKVTEAIIKSIIYKYYAAFGELEEKLTELMK
jgi:nucleotidyltransferase substrate binding protein (TIGR01987 family)